jgi:hypothetical protein
VPRDFDPFKSVIASLTSKSSADENRIEVSRIHAILHPNCFERLIAAFGYGAPEKQLELPRFFLDETNDQAPPRQRNAPADLSAEELAEIDEMLAEQSGRRRRSSSTGVIRIMVDGVERGRFNPAEQSSISFTAEEDTELIEVRTTDASGDLLLATYLLTSFVQDATDATVASIRLEGGQYLSLSIARRSTDANGGGDLLVQFGYHETTPLRAARLWWQRLSLRGPERISAQHGFAAAVIVLVVALTTYLGYVRLTSLQTTNPQTSQTSGSQISSVQVNPPATPLPTAAPIPTQKADQPHKATAKATPSRSSAAVAQPRDDEVTDLTRSGNVAPNLKLSDVKKVYVEIRGDATNGLRENLIESLNSSGVVTVANSTDEADAALKIVVSETGASARLVNARGTVLWPKAGARRYSGDAPKVVSEITQDLLSEIRLARRH